MVDLNKIKSWKQNQIIHCPNNDCKGMLLDSIECHEYKCSDCGKYWWENSKWIELDTAWQEDNPDELLMDILRQCCSDENLDEIDNNCISAFEDACVYLEKKGYLQKINDRMYKVIRKSKIFNHIEGIN
jgi:hypothetical protein